MKRFLKILLIFVASLLLLLLIFLIYLGAFSSPSVSEKNMGPYTYIYEEHIGPYKDAGRIFEKVYKSALENNIKVKEGIGIYFDDPAKVPAEKLRSYCGAVLDPSEETRIKEIEHNYKTGKIEAGNSLVTEFPIKNNLSYMLIPMKAYPALAKYAEQKKLKTGPPYELYEGMDKVYVVVPILPN